MTDESEHSEHAREIMEGRLREAARLAKNLGVHPAAAVATVNPNWFPEGADVPFAQIRDEPGLSECLKRGLVRAYRVQADGTEDTIPPGWWRGDANISHARRTSGQIWVGPAVGRATGAPDKAAPAASAEQSAYSANKGGAPGKHDWEAAIIELARLNHHEGIVGKNQSDLVRHLQGWFADKGLKIPGDSQIKERVRAFMQAVAEN